MKSTMGASRPAYSTLDLDRAYAFGWDSQHNLNLSEVKVLHFIALRGIRKDEGLAFAWFPIGGQEWWAAIMMLPLGTLSRALSTLRKKGLIVDRKGSTSDKRYFSMKGYGIPVAVMEEATEWYQARSEMAYTTAVPDTPGILTGEDGPLIPEDSSSYLSTPNAVTRDFPVLTHRETPEKDPTTYVGSATADLKEHEMTDSWGDNSDGDSDWSQPNDPKPKKAPAPTTVLAQEFYDGWVVAREKKKNLSSPWSKKVAVLTTLKQLLAEPGMDEALVSQMIKVFYRQVEVGHVQLRSDELWWDFWGARSKLRSLARQQMTDTSKLTDIAALVAKNAEKAKMMRGES